VDASTGIQPPESLPASPMLRFAWLGIASAAFALYAATASRGVQWQDSSHFMFRIATGDLLGDLGLALAHPLHHWLGRAAVAIGGLGPYTITLVSAVFGALAVANVFGCVRRLTGDARAALFAAASLAVANTFWRLSTLVEVYTIGAALLGATCWCLVIYGQGGSRKFFWFACFLNGLGVANDLQASLSFPALMALAAHEIWRGRLSVADGAVAALAWLAGSLPYSWLVVAELVATGELVATVRSALFGKVWADNLVSTGVPLRTLVVDVCFPLLNFPNLLLPAALYGLLRSRHMDVSAAVRWTLLGILAFQAAFALTYGVIDQYTFFLPTYVMLSIFGGVGAARVLRAQPRVRGLVAIAVALLVATPLTYAMGTEIARRSHLLARFERNKPYRDDYVYLLIPWTFVDRSAEQMSRQVLALAGPDGRIVIEDWMGDYAVRFSALLAGWGDPEGIWWEDPGLDAFTRDAVADEVPVVLIPWDRDHPRAAPSVGRWRRDGDVYVLDR
jgi:hypothetical protein